MQITNFHSARKRTNATPDFDDLCLPLCKAGIVACIAPGISTEDAFTVAFNASWSNMFCAETPD